MAVDMAQKAGMCEADELLKPLVTADRAIVSLSRFMKFLGGGCLMGMVLITAADIIGRYFGHPVFGSEELTAMLAALSAAFAMPYAHRKDVHVGVEMVVNRLPVGLRDIISGVVHFVSFMLFSLVSWRMFAYGSSLKRSGELSMNLELPEYMVVYVLAACFAVFALQLFTDFLRSMTRV